MFSQECINQIPDEVTRYIVSRVEFCGPEERGRFNIIRDKLAEELNLPKAAISRKYTAGVKFMLSHQKEEKKQQYDKYYDGYGNLSFANIAEFKNIDSEDLKNAFCEYIDSFTIEEQIEASCKPFSKAAGKSVNINILLNRVKGFSECLNSFSGLNLSEIRKLEYYLLDCVDEIYSSYLECNNLQPKQYVISKE